MAMPSSPVARSVVEQDPVDDEWEKFQANGCPDWWLLARYVGAAARSFPYQPFRGMSAAGGVAEHVSKRGDTQSEGGMPQAVELQQQSPKGQQNACPAAAGSSTEAQKPAGCAADPTAMSPREAADNSSTSRSMTLPDALPTCPARTTLGAAATEGSAPAACGLKGIFACNGGCTPACSAAAQTADQKG